MCDTDISQQIRKECSLIETHLQRLTVARSMNEVKNQMYLITKRLNKVEELVRQQNNIKM